MGKVIDIYQAFWPDNLELSGTRRHLLFMVVSLEGLTTRLCQLAKVLPRLQTCPIIGVREAFHDKCNSGFLRLCRELAVKERVDHGE